MARDGDKVKRAWYCKGLKKTGKPIIVDVNGAAKNTAHYAEKGCLSIRMKYNNAPARARASGATTVLEVNKLPPDKCAKVYPSSKKNKGNKKR